MNTKTPKAAADIPAEEVDAEYLGLLVDLGGGERLVALEVDDADAVIREAVLPAPPGESLPWASGVARREGSLVPILDWSALVERIK